METLIGIGYINFQNLPKFKVTSPFKETLPNDIIELSGIDYSSFNSTFSNEKPLLPFHQLALLLPLSSFHLLPMTYQRSFLSRLTSTDLVSFSIVNPVSFLKQHDYFLNSDERKRNSETDPVQYRNDSWEKYTSPSFQTVPRREMPELLAGFPSCYPHLFQGEKSITEFFISRWQIQDSHTGQIPEWVEVHESLECEFKLIEYDLGKRNYLLIFEFLKDICALNNVGGGSIFFGVPNGQSKMKIASKKEFGLKEKPLAKFFTGGISSKEIRDIFKNYATGMPNLTYSSCRIDGLEFSRLQVAACSSPVTLNHSWTKILNKPSHMVYPWFPFRMKRNHDIISVWVDRNSPKMEAMTKLYKYLIR